MHMLNTVETFLYQDNKGDWLLNNGLKCLHHVCVCDTEREREITHTHIYQCTLYQFNEDIKIKSFRLNIKNNHYYYIYSIVKFEVFQFGLKSI